MVEQPIAQFLVFVWGNLYLLLHAGPMVRLWYGPSIRTLTPSLSLKGEGV